MKRKRISKQILAIALAAAVTIGMSGAGATSVQAATKNSVTSVTITAPAKVSAQKTKSYSLYQLSGKAAKVTVKAKIKVKGKASKKIYFKSSNTKLAKVGKTTGKVVTNGKKTGTVKITAYAKANKNKKATLKVTIKKFAPAVNSAKLTKTVSYSGSKVSAGKVALKSNAGVKSVSYSSSNTKVLTVDKKGNVTAVGVGSAYIKVRATANGGSSKTVNSSTVTVKQAAPVKEFAPSVKDIAINIPLNAASATGKLVVSGEDVKGATFKSADEKIATVAADGTVTAVGVGTTNVTVVVTSTGGATKTLTAKVTVTATDPDATTINYAKANYDFESNIASEKEALDLVPAAAEVPFTVADEKGATGVVLVPSSEEENTTDVYLNAMVAGDKLVFTPENGKTIALDTSTSSEGVTDADASDTTVTVLPKTLNAETPTDEIIAFTSDGVTYKVHTVNEYMPTLDIEQYGNSVAVGDAGVYTFVVDKFLLRVDTAGKLVYYRNMLCTGHNMCEGLAPHKTADGTMFFTYFAELRQEYRNANGGYSSGMYVVMDENYKEIDQVTQAANTDPNHTHGEGYLDQHEFVVLGANHYLALSYTPEHVTNIPVSTGVTSGYVWAGVFQEIKDDEVVWEISTADYPLLYKSAVEKFDYANSTDQGTVVVINGANIDSLADGWQDYVHVNSLDYTLDADGNLNKLLVSMRDQSAVYQFDIPTAGIDWIMGGKASTLSVDDEYTTTRSDDQNKETFKALTFGQHHARYLNKAANGTLTGNAEISVFDNQTGMAPFLRKMPVATNTRTFKATIDTTAKTADVHDVINGKDLDTKLYDTDKKKYHNASHCGSVQYQSATSTTIGWGLHGVIDNIPSNVNFAEFGTMSDIGFEDLRQGSIPIFTDYDMTNDKITFELSTLRNAKAASSLQGEAMFSYRTYKTPTTID